MSRFFSGQRVKDKPEGRQAGAEPRSNLGRPSED